MSNKNYADLAKKREASAAKMNVMHNNSSNYISKNEAYNRPSVYPENEFEEVEIRNNLKNIKRMTGSNIKLPSKEKYSGQANIKSSQKVENTVGSISTINGDEKYSAHNYNIYPVRIDNDSGLNLESYLESTKKLPNVSNISNSHDNSPISHRPFANKNLGSNLNLNGFINQNNNKMTIKNYVFGNQEQSTDNHINHFQNNQVNLGTQRVNRSFDYKKLPIKKGMFSYPKSLSNAMTTYNLADSNNEKYTASNRLLNSQLNLVPSGGNIIDVSSSNISIPNNYSIDKYQIIKNLNANISSRSVNLIDENDSMSGLKKNESTSSINFNKYKVGLGISTVLNNSNPIHTELSNTNLFGVNSQSEVTTLWKNNFDGVSDSSQNYNIRRQINSSQNINNSQSNLIKISKDNLGQSTVIKNMSNNIQEMVSRNNNPQLLAQSNMMQGSLIQSQLQTQSQAQSQNQTMSYQQNNSQFNKDKYHTFANNNLNDIKSTVNNTPNPSSKALIQLTENTNNLSSMRNKNVSSSIIFKNKQRHEKETRRMLVEMIKLKSKRKEQTIDKIVKEMKINENVLLLNRSDIPSNLLNNNDVSKLTNPTNEVFNHLSGALEIKNNNFEINNNYFANVNSFKNTDPNIVSKTIPQFIYNMDEDSSEKVNMICYLVSPRVLHMNIGSINNSTNNYKIPFVFQLTPTSLCYEYGIEHYIFQWSELKSISPVGSIDILKIASCSKNSNQENIFTIETSKEKSLSTGHTSLNLTSENNRYEIITNNTEECKLYVNALNYLSQLVKCKAYSFKGNSKIKV